jgi:CspA family cold shock protein
MDKVFGYINSYDSLKGYGFIRREKGKDLFFHYTRLVTEERNIGEGDKVSFLIEEGGKGEMAVDVEKVM